MLPMYFSGFQEGASLVWFRASYSLCAKIMAFDDRARL